MKCFVVVRMDPRRVEVPRDARRQLCTFNPEQPTPAACDAGQVYAAYGT